MIEILYVSLELKRHCIVLCEMNLLCWVELSYSMQKVEVNHMELQIQKSNNHHYNIVERNSQRCAQDADIERHMDGRKTDS